MFNPRLLPSKIPLVVDVGCGTGNITKHIHQLVAAEKVIGLDVSKEMIDFGKEHHSEKGTKYVVADITANDENFTKRILGEDQLADVVVSIHCLQWIPEHMQSKAMANIRSLLKPGGRCYLVVFSWSDILPAFEDMVLHPKWRKYFKSVIEDVNDVPPIAGQSERRRRKSSAPFNTLFPVPEEERIRAWKQRCSELYFEDYEVTLRKVSFDFETWPKFQLLLKSICHFLPRIPDEEKESFLQDYYAHAYECMKIKLGIPEERICILDYEIFLIKAKKP